MHREQKYKQYSDHELLSKLKDGFESPILGELYHRYGHLVFGVGLKILDNKQDSEDMTMNLFMSLQDKIQKNEIQNFKSWLYRVALNECYMRLRKNKTIRETHIDEAHLQYIEEEADTARNLDCFDAHMQIGLSQLKMEHQKAIQLFYNEEMSYVEISQTSGWDIKTVKSYIQNAKRNLKIILQKLCDGK